MSNESLLSYYESQLCKLSAQNAALKDENLSIKVQYQQLSRKLTENEMKMIEKDQIIIENQNKSKRYHQKNEQLQSNLKKRHIEYKSLYNYVFVDHEVESSKDMGLLAKSMLKQQNLLHDNQLDLYNNTSLIAYSHYDQQIVNLKKAINKRNQTLQQLLKENNKLKLSITDCTHHYQIQIMKLKEQIIILKNQSITQNNPPQSHTFINQDLKKLQLKCKSLQLSLQLSNKKIQTLTSLSAQKSSSNLNSNNNNQTNCNIYSTSNKLDVIDQTLKIVTQNETLTQENIRLNQQIINLTQQFPYLFQNRNSIDRLIKKYKQQQQLKQKLRQYENKIELLEDEINKQKIMLQKIQNNKIKLFCYNSKKYQQIIRLVIKLKQSLEIVDPYFKNLYRYRTTGVLDQTDIQFVETQFKQQVATFEKLYEEIAKLNIQLSQLQTNINSKDKQISQQQSKINEQCIQIQNQKAIIDSNIFNCLKEVKQNSNYSYQIYQKCIKQLQQQRQSLCKAIRVQEIQIGQLIAQRDHHRDSKSINNIMYQHSKIEQFKSINIEIITNELNTENVIKRINQNNQEIRRVMMQSKAQLHTIIRQYENKILKMEKQITILKQQQCNKQLEINQKPQERHHESKSNISRGHQIIDGSIEQQFKFTDQSQLPLNTISQESITYMNQLLSKHQAMLKNILQEYDKLKNNYNEVLNKLKKYRQIQSLQEQLNRNKIQLKGALLRLKQADSNLLLLQNQLEVSEKKCKQLQQTNKSQMEILRQENQLLHQKQKSLTETLQNIKSQLFQSISLCQTNVANTNSQTMNDNAVVSLLTILKKKDDEITNYKKLIRQMEQKTNRYESKLKKLQNQQKQKTREIQNEQIFQIQNLIKQGLLMQVIEKAINVLKNVGYKHGQMEKQII